MAVAVPENFAENAKAFYDVRRWCGEALDPTHDYSFLIDFKLDEAKTGGNVFYAIPSDAPFALILQSNNQIDFFTNLLKPNGDSNSFASIYAYYQSDVKLQGRRQIECKIEANMLSSYLDGVLVAQKTSNLERTGTATVGIPNCNSGYVYKIKITDLTDNQVVWSYPSEAERVRLITKTNVRTDRGRSRRRTKRNRRGSIPRWICAGKYRVTRSSSISKRRSFLKQQRWNVIRNWRDRAAL